MKQIEGTDYFVKEDGSVYKKGSKKAYLTKTGNGYLFIKCKFGNILVHRAVAMAYLENKYDYLVVHHIDGDKMNNHVSNLMWTTQRRNVRISYSNDLHNIYKGNREGKYRVRFIVAKRYKSFGTFNDLESAKAHRDYIMQKYDF